MYEWLYEAHRKNDIAIVKKILELLKLVPVTVRRLKINEAPKFIRHMVKSHCNTGYFLYYNLNVWKKNLKLNSSLKQRFPTTGRDPG